MAHLQGQYPPGKHFDDMKVNNSSFQNREYDPGRGVLIRALWYLVSAVIFQTYLLPFYKPKRALLRLFGSEVGEGLVIKPNVNIKYPWNLTLGAHVWIGEGVWIDNLALVTVGDNVCISQGAYLLTGNHNYKIPTFDLMTGPIVLEEGVWIGAKSTVCPDVTCESHAILSVGAVANKDLLAYGIYSGLPAQLVKYRRISDIA